MFFHNLGRDVNITLLLGQGFHSTNTNMLKPPKIHGVSRGHTLGQIITGSVMTPRFILCKEIFENWCYGKPNFKKEQTKEGGINKGGCRPSLKPGCRESRPGTADHDR